MHSPHGQLLDQGKGGCSGDGRPSTAASAMRLQVQQETLHALAAWAAAGPGVGRVFGWRALKHGRIRHALQVRGPRRRQRGRRVVQPRRPAPCARGRLLGCLLAFQVYCDTVGS